MKEQTLHSILSGERPALTYAHPIIDLRSGEVAAREFLTRFEGPDGQVSTVGSLLEDLTLDPAMRIRLDMVCLGAVFTALAAHPVTGHLVFVNLHPLTLGTPDFWKAIQPWLWNLSIPPHRVVIEITEGFSLHDMDQLEDYAAKLRAMELRIAVDDLGSGVASLAHMARIAPDFIKVDRSLVTKVHRRPYQAALLNALAVFAERMNVGYIAEGIETAEELQAIRDADVPWGQGFIFGEPVPLRLGGPVEPVIREGKVKPPRRPA
jgi:EAL domain-containing protein (putative c-di-GMP-specific phosphodiesterase class I)